MITAPSEFVDANKLLAREVIAYAERCAFPDVPCEPLVWLREQWQFHNFETGSTMSPAIVALFSNGRMPPFDTAFISLTDQEGVVALRILLALSRVTIGQLRAGLKEEHFPPFTFAVRAFVRSSIHIHRSNAASWTALAVQILRFQKPKLMVIEGLQFVQPFLGNSILAQSAEIISLAAANETGLLLFD